MLSVHLLIIVKFGLVTMCETVQLSMSVYDDAWLTKCACTLTLFVELLSENYYGFTWINMFLYLRS